MAYTEGLAGNAAARIPGRTAEEILAYVLRDMTDPAGGFYSAEDADSEGREGKFYVWTVEEVEQVLGEEDAGLVRRIYNLQERGNFADEATGDRTGENIPHLREALAEETIRVRLEELREKLFAYREDRGPPTQGRQGPYGLERSHDRGHGHRRTDVQGIRVHSSGRSSGRVSARGPCATERGDCCTGIGMARPVSRPPRPTTRS